MSLLRIVVLSLIALIIAITAFVGQAAFRLDQTFLGYRYTQDALGEWLTPLEEDATRAGFIDDIMEAVLRDALSGIPRNVVGVLEDAAAESFSSAWFVSTIKGIHASVYRVMRGTTTSLKLIISLGNFSNTARTRARERLPEGIAEDVSAQLSRMPSSVDLWEGVDPAQQTRVQQWIRRVPLFSLLLQYAVPGLFLLLTLVFGKPGSALVASGVGLGLSGGVMMVYVSVFAQGTANTVARAIRSAVPGSPGWLSGPVSASFLEAIRSSVPFAGVLIGTGVFCIALGALVIWKWGDSFSTMVGAAGGVLRDRKK